MKAMQCELCGSTEIIKDGDFFVCQSCGMKYTLENARKMMVEGVVQVEGTVKTDRSDDVERYMKLARTARESCNYKDAEKYAAKILEIDLSNAEAWAIRSMAIDWQLSLGNDRLTESQAAFLEMYKLLREPNHDYIAITRNLALLVDYYAHLQKISKAEATLFTNPIKSHPNSTSLAFIKEGLPRHLEFRKTQLEAIGTLCKLLLNEADKMTSDDELEEEKRAALAKVSAQIRNTVSEQIPRLIGFMYRNAAESAAMAAGLGAANWGTNWYNSPTYLTYAYPEKAGTKGERDYFDSYTRVHDNCADAIKAAVSFCDQECVRSSIDNATFEKSLFHIWGFLCSVEKFNIDHKMPYLSFSQQEMQLRNGELKKHQEIRDKYDPAKKAQKEIERAKRELEKKREAAKKDFCASNQEMMHRGSNLNESIAKLTAEIEELTRDAKSCLFFERKRKEQLNQQIEEKQSQLAALKQEEGEITSALNDYVESQTREEAAKVKELELKKQ